MEKKGMEMMVEEDLEKTLHSVMVMWTDKDDTKNKGVEKGDNNESENCPIASEGEKEEGHSSDMDLRKLFSKRWSRDARKTSNKGNSTPDDNRGGKSEDGEDSGERDSARKRSKLGKKRGDSIVGVDVSPVKNTRSST